MTYLTQGGGAYTNTDFDFTMYSTGQAAPMTAFSAPAEDLASGETASVKWLGPSHFVINIDGADRFDCQFKYGEQAVWRSL